MRKIYDGYLSNFRGLSREIWLLSLVTFINRAGAMIIPFLSLYLVNAKGFSLPQVGWIMTSFGVGSLVGTWVGGKLTDTIGFYKVIIFSLLLGGIGFFLLQFIDSFYGFCLGIFLVILTADAYKPAIFVAAETYSKPENVTRTITLIRLAINLGFSIGPLVGGIIIAKINYVSLFWIDGITCISAALCLFLLLKPKRARKEIPVIRVNKEGISPYKNGIYILFFVIMVAQTLAFVQYFSVMPIYYERDHFLTEDLIGWLMFINGAMIVIFEMPLIAWLEKKKISKTMAVFWGIVFFALSFFALNITAWSGILIFGMVLMTLGEMIGSPFANSLALELAPKGRKGSYMGMYSMSFSLAHIIGHNSGMNMAATFGFNKTWFILGLFLLTISALSYYLHRLLKKSRLVEIK